MASQYVSTRPSAAELRAKPTLCQGQNDDLKIDTGRVRYWITREPGDHTVSVEHLIGGRWITMQTYNGRTNS